MIPSTKHQVDTLAHYLIGRAIDNPNIYKLYNEVVSNQQQALEDKLIAFAFNHPKTIPSLDAALVFLRPQSELRRRIYIVFAVLEATPEYTRFFLPKRLNIFSTVGVCFAGLRAIVRAIVGTVIIKVARL